MPTLSELVESYLSAKAAQAEAYDAFIGFASGQRGRPSAYAVYRQASLRLDDAAVRLADHVAATFVSEARA